MNISHTLSSPTAHIQTSTRLNTDLQHNTRPLRAPNYDTVRGKSGPQIFFAGIKHTHFVVLHSVCLIDFECLKKLLLYCVVPFSQIYCF